jgi:hypothetical protein
MKQQQKHLNPKAERQRGHEQADCNKLNRFVIKRIGQLKVSKNGNLVEVVDRVFVSAATD